MEFRKVLALRGPNIWANFPVLEAWVDLGELDKPSTDFPGFSDRLMSWMPSMIEHRCSIGQRGGFFQRLRTGTYLGPHPRTRHAGTADPGRHGSRFRQGPRNLRSRASTRLSSSISKRRWAASVWRWPASCAWPPSSIGRSTSAKEIERLRDLAQQVCLGPSTRAIVQAAQARNIPCRRLNTESLVLFGHGRKQRRIQAAETDRTSAIAEAIAQDKEMTRMLLRAVGVPTPYGRPVKDADDAWAAACDIGVPVVVKPQDGNQGRGVATNLTTREQIVDGLRSRPEGKRVGAGREVRPGPRLSAVGRGRSGGGRRPPRARPSRWRRHPQRGPTGRAGQRRSPPRRAPRHGAQQDQARRHRLGGAGRSRADARLGAAGRRRRC